MHLRPNNLLKEMCKHKVPCYKPKKHNTIENAKKVVVQEQNSFHGINLFKIKDLLKKK